MALPDLRLEFDPNGSPSTVTPAWRDLSSYVRLTDGVDYTTGRQDELASVYPGYMTCTLNNDSGRFTPGNANAISAWGVDLTIRVPIRLRARFGGSSVYGGGTYGTGTYSPTVAGNMLAAEDASFEGGTTGTWVTGGSVPPTLSNSASHPQDGTKGLLITWGTGGFLPLAGINVTGFVIGRYYTFSAYVWVPTGSPDPLLVSGAAGGTFGTATSTKNALTRISVTFQADATTLLLSVWPNTAPTAGQTCFVDAVQLDEGTTLGTFTTSPMPVYDVWNGFVDSWADAWTGGRRGVTRVRASDRMATLNRLTLDPMPSAEILNDGPGGYWPMTDGSGATAATNRAAYAYATPATVTQVGSGGTATFGSTAAPGVEGTTVLDLAPASAGNGKCLVSVYPGGTFASTGRTLEALINTSSSTSQVVIRRYGYDDPNTKPWFSLGVTSLNKLQAITDWGPPGLNATVTSAASVTGGWVHVAAVESTSGGTTTLTLYINGSSVGSSNFTSTGYTAPVFYASSIGGLPSFGGVVGSNLFTGSMANVAYHDTPLSAGRLLDHAFAAITGLTGELSNVRFNRICRLANLPSGSYVATEAGLSTMGPQPTGGVSATQALNDVAAAEAGLVFISTNGLVGFNGRSHRYNAIPAFTLLASDVAPDLEFVTDDQILYNDVTVNRPGGTATRTINTASVAQYGTSDLTTTIYTDVDTITQSLSQYLANVYAEPQTRVGSVTVDLYTKSNTAPVQAILASQIGNRFTLSSLPPANAPAASADLFIEGISGRISEREWQWRANATPAVFSAVWQLDSSSYSQLDTSTVLAF